MTLNWVEEIVSHLYKLRGYIVIENEDLPMPEGVGGRSETDIIAIRDRKLVHVECMVCWAPGRQDEENQFRRLRYRFNQAPDVIFERYNLNGGDYEKRRVFVTDRIYERPQPKGPWGRLQNFCSNEGIELKEINSVIEDLIAELRERYPPEEQLVGKEEGIARFLIHLIRNDFLKRPQE